MTMYQQAPYPEALEEVTKALKYKPHWKFTLEQTDRGQGSHGMTLCILITTPDSYNHERMRSVMHYMPVPPAAFDKRSWQRWLFEQILLVERHEACEFFTIDGSKPYAPSHGPGNDPYIVREIGTEEDARTSYKGVLT